MNWPTIIVAAVVAAVFLTIVIKGVINRKNGKSYCKCGGGCGSCALKDTCHGKDKGNTKD